MCDWKDENKLREAGVGPFKKDRDYILFEFQRINKEIIRFAIFGLTFKKKLKKQKKTFILWRFWFIFWPKMSNF